MRRFTVQERRARLAVRHRLAPGTRAADPAGAAHGVLALHSTDPASVFVSAWARMHDGDVAAVERALYEERTLVRVMGMRRTVFVAAAEDAAVIVAACGRDVAARERRKLLALLAEAGSRDPEAQVTEAEALVLDALHRHGDVTASEIGATDPRLDAASARAALARRWLHAFGPATADDLRWWTGWGVRDTRAALAAAGAVEVDLAGAPGMALPDDLEDVAPPEPWAALLPALDPTTMGWKDREAFLGGHGPQLFDATGNASPTVWWHGRAVGGWAHRPGGEIAYTLLEDAGAEAAAAIEAQAAALQDALGDVVLAPRARGRSAVEAALLA